MNLSSASAVYISIVLAWIYNAVRVPPGTQEGHWVSAHVTGCLLACSLQLHVTADGCVSLQQCGDI